MADTTKSTIELLIDTLNSSKNIQEVTKASKDLQKQLALAGQESKDFAKGASALANYKDKVGDVKNALAALDPDKKAQAFVGLGQGIVGSFSVATGALNLFGAENEKLNAIVGKTTQLISVLQGINSIQQAAEQAGIIKAIFLKQTDIIATEGQTAATAELTVAQRALNLAMGPLGLIVGAIGAIVIAYNLWSDSAEKVVETQTAINNELELTKSLYKNLLDETTFYEDLQIRLKQNEIELLKKTNLDKKTLNEAYYAQLDKLENELLVIKQNKEKSGLVVAREEAEKQLSILEGDYKKRESLHSIYIDSILAREKAKANIEGKTFDEEKARRVAEQAFLNTKEGTDFVSAKNKYDAIKLQYETSNRLLEVSNGKESALSIIHQAELTTQVTGQAKERNKRFIESEEKRVAKVYELQKQAEAQIIQSENEFISDYQKVKEINSKNTIGLIQSENAKENAKKNALINEQYDKELKVIQLTVLDEEDKDRAIELSNAARNKALTENNNNYLLTVEQKIKDEFDLEIQAQEKLNDLAKQKSQERVELLRAYIAYTNQALQSLLSLNEIATNLEQQRLAQTELRTKQYYDHVTQVREQAYSVEQNALNAKYQKEYNAASGNAAKQQQITDKYNLASKKAEKDKVDYVNKLAYQRAQVEYQNAIERNRIAEIEFRRNKAFQISSAIINTAAGVAGALAHSGDETPPAAIAQSIAIGIAGAAQIAKIASTKFNPSDVGQPPVAPIVEPNLNASTSTNNLTNAAQKPLEFNTEFLTTGKLQGQQLIKVYVLESEITNVQNSVRAQISSNSF